MLAVQMCIRVTPVTHKQARVHDSRTNINFTSLYPPVTTECISVCTIVVIVCMNISYACYMLYAYYICITLNVTAFKNQDHSLRDYRKYFKPLLCYMEGGWTTETQNIQEPFYSDRHHLDASSWLDLQNKVCIQACSNVVDIEAAVMKHRSEVRRQAFTSYQMVRGFSPGNILKSCYILTSIMCLKSSLKIEINSKHSKYMSVAAAVTMYEN